MKGFHKERHVPQARRNEKCAGPAPYVLESPHAIRAWLETDPKRILHLEAFTPINQRCGQLLELAKDKGVTCSIRNVERSPHGRLRAHCTQFPYLSMDHLRLTDSGAQLVVLIDGLTDPRNLGAIIRSANATCASGVILPAHRCCQVTPTVEGASAGATAFTPIVRVVNLVRTIQLLKERDLWIFALDPTGEVQLFDLDLPSRVAFVIGGEAGMGRLVREHADLRLRIPMSGRLEALNASVAASIALYSWYRLHGKSLDGG